jgi:hypothetical protein
VFGADFTSETFRILKQEEEKARRTTSSFTNGVCPWRLTNLLFIQPHNSLELASDATRRYTGGGCVPDSHPVKSVAMHSVVSLTLLYNNLKDVIPAKAGIQIEKTGFRIKSGMTKCVKSFMKHYTMHRNGFHWVGIWNTAATRISSCGVAGQLQ